MTGIDQEFLDELRSRTSLPGVIGARTKLSRSGRNWKGCCPFHGEKTPSFYVYDDHFHCFGCGKHGDVITFVMENQNLQFMDAVEKLAGEAGLKMPQMAPEQAAQNKKRTEAKKSAADALQIALNHYCQELRAGSGLEARRYLENRGITPATADKFALGWAPRGQDLIELFERNKVSPQTAINAGLVRDNNEQDGRTTSTDFSAARLFFYDRLMIPIFNDKGSIVSFGGRTLGDGQPKYINGPETPLFHKKRNLFNFFRARQSQRVRTHLLVVEGYLDVIALDQYGIDSAVAPLGTAVGEEQLKMLWRVSDAPIFCLDGDKAGLGAAMRVCDRALEFLKVGYTLKFCFLPAGEDPDSFIRGKGVEAFEALIEKPLSLAQAAYKLLQSSIVQDPNSPDQRAKFKSNLYALAEKITDFTLKAEYKSEWIARFNDEYHARQYQKSGQSARKSFGKGKVIALNKVTPGAKQRLDTLTGLILAYPEIFGEVESSFWDIKLPETLNEIRMIVGEAALTDEWTVESLMETFEQKGLKREVGRLLKLGTQFHIREGGPTAKDHWEHIYGFLNLQQEIDGLQQDINKEILEGSGERLAELTQRMQSLKAKARGENASGVDGFKS